MKVGVAKRTSGPPLTMETRLELTECSSLLEKKTFKYLRGEMGERREFCMKAERDEGVKERGRERREERRKGQPKWEAAGKER